MFKTNRCSSLDINRRCMCLFNNVHTHNLNTGMIKRSYYSDLESYSLERLIKENEEFKEYGINDFDGLYDKDTYVSIYNLIIIEQN